MLVPVRMIMDGIATSAFDASCIRLQDPCHDKIDPRFVCRRGYNDLSPITSELFVRVAGAE